MWPYICSTQAANQLVSSPIGVPVVSEDSDYLVKRKLHIPPKSFNAAAFRHLCLYVPADLHITE